MIRYTEGNLLDADVEALVNTVNTVGVMGKGIALQFRDQFPENTAAYSAAFKRGELQIGRMFATETQILSGRRWIINFPTKKHWRQPSKLEYVEAGLADLVRVVRDLGIRSIALPPLGCGNGGLDWSDVRPMIERAFAELPEVDVLVYQPTDAYQARPKGMGTEELTVARALLVDLVRKYIVLGLDCSNLEVQKLAYLMQRVAEGLALPDEMKLRFKAHRYGPYADGLRHLMDRLDGSYLKLEKRAADAGAFDPIALDTERLPRVEAFLANEGAAYLPALGRVDELIDGFQTPYLMELLATVDWIVRERGGDTDVEGILDGLRSWPGDPSVARRKVRLFDRRNVELALERLSRFADLLYPAPAV